MLTIYDGMRVLEQGPWAVEASRWRAVEDFFRFRLRAGALTLGADDIQAFQAAAGGSSPKPRQANGVGIVPVYGLLTQHPSLFSLIFGGSTYTGIVAAVREMMADESVGTIVLDVDSGGGQVHGAEEAAAALADLKGTKPLLSVANPFMASAAYWFASTVDEIVGSVSSETGSLGVFIEHVDFSEMDAKDGIKRTLISAGKYKAEGMEGYPLTDEGRAALTARAEGFYDLLVRRVAANRGATPAQVRSGYGEGRVLQAKDAKEAGLIDRIDSFENTVARALSGRKARGPRAELLRDKLALDTHLAGL